MHQENNTETRAIGVFAKNVVALSLFCICAAPVLAGQYTYTSAVTSTGNNFTMLDPTGALVGGTNDVVFTWNGTLNDAVAGAVSNATLASDETFFGSRWDAHDVTMYGPGTYTIYDGCAAGNAACGSGNAVTFTVGPNQIGAHMLFDWPAGSGTNIDVVNVWDRNSTWAAQNAPNPFWAGLDDGTACTGTGCVVDGVANTDTTSFNFLSIDVNNNGIPGLPMTDGAFVNFNASFNVNGVNFPPTAGDFSTSTQIVTPKVIDLAANSSDTDGSVIPGSAAIVPASGPANGVLINNGDGTVTYTPNGGFASPPTDSFQYTINDNDGAVSNTGTVTITVTAGVNNPPVANDTTVSTDEDTAVNITAASVGVDANGDPLTFQIFDSPTTMGGSVTANGDNTVLTYTPPANFNGADTFTFSVSDGTDTSNTATITVNVTSVNDAPVCTDVTLNTDPDTELLIDVPNDLLTTCTDADGDSVTLETTTQPAEPGSTLAYDGVSTLTYTPATGFSGQDSFTYTATDGVATSGAQTAFIDVGKIYGNFTMLDSDGVTFGGTNDIVFTWDGNCYSSTAEADAGAPNMTMASDSSFPFFGFPWSAHDIKVFCPGGPYVFDTCNNASIPADKCGDLSMTVPAGHLGAHILFDWNVTADIDVAIVWNNSAGGTWQNVVPSGQLYQGPAGPTPALDEFYDWISVDGDGDGIPGIKFVDGPFINFRANFNFKTTAGGGGEVVAPPTSAPSPDLGGGCTIARAPARRSLKDADWLVISGFIAAVGIRARRRKIEKSALNGQH